MKQIEVNENPANDTLYCSHTLPIVSETGWYGLY